MIRDIGAVRGRSHYRNSATKLVKTICAIMLGATFPVSATSAEPTSSKELSNELVVHFDSAMWGHPEELISAIKDRVPVVVERLGDPSSGRMLVQLRILPKFLSVMPRDDPRISLHETIVLTYPTKDVADRAEGILRGASGVRALTRSTLGRLSAVPNDPLLSATSNQTEYQWGADRLKLYAAWDKVRGTAYAAILDNGIQIHGLNLGSPVTHPDLSPNFRPQFSHNFSLTNGPNGAANTSNNVDEEPYTVTIGGTTYTNIAGHGSHTAGILAARGNNGIGVAGTCQHCGLLVGRITVWSSTAQSLKIDQTTFSDGIVWMANVGSQVINSSLGFPTGITCTFPGTPTTPCAALDAADLHGVVVVAAAGNARTNALEFPASYSNVFAATGAQYDSSGVSFWDGTTSPNFGSNYSPAGDTFSAPAKDVISSVYTGTDWSADAACGDSYPTSTYASGYGDCNGTSMAAPAIAGIVALIRSAQPTLTVSEVRTILAANSIACSGSLASRCGYGVPDASKAVTAALGGPAAINRLTPLFSFYSSDREHHFYTVVPQMGTAAILGTLLPVSYTSSQFSYSSIGPLVSGYSAFPGVLYSGCGFSPPCDPLYPRATVSVFTSFKSPIPGSPDLLPLYRLSWSCPNSSSCTNSNHTSHAYATNTSEDWPSQEYKVDGIEGYVFSPSIAQPPGTVKLCRKYSSARDDYVLFPGAGASGTDCSATSDGYSGGSYSDPDTLANWIGWVYPARAPQRILSPAVAAILLDD